MPAEIRVLSAFSSRVTRARLVSLAERALRAEHSRADVTIYITGDVEIRKLNRAFHATNAATDVLSFPSVSRFLPNARQSPPESPRYLGDVVISYERAREQARAAGWRIADELDLLTVHGILHLLGYDDLSPRARIKMWKRQEQILERAIRGK
jgi:probable rRNA maturation factor